MCENNHFLNDCDIKITPYYYQLLLESYRKIPKISPEAYIFQRPFLGGLFLEGLIFRGAYLWREICISKSIGLALKLEGNLPFLLCFTLYLKAISKYKPPGGLYLEGQFNGGFFALWDWGAYIWRDLFSEFYSILMFDKRQPTEYNLHLNSGNFLFPQSQRKFLKKRHEKKYGKQHLCPLFTKKFPQKVPLLIAPTGI